MIPGMNPKQLEKAMKKMGVKQEQIDATEVIIKTPEKDIIISQPQVSKVNMMGQETWQVVGEAHEVETGALEVSDDDIQTVVAQTGVSAEQAKEVLEKHNGDIAAAILELGQK